MQLSIVAPCYNEEESLAAFCERALSAARDAAERFEIVLVDDGSRDRTWPLIQSLAHMHPEVVGVRLLRNHGHQLAASAGLAVSRGERVMLIDADLQDPPELLSDMMRLMNEGADVVYGQRISREGETWFKTWSASVFYRVLSKLTSIEIPKDTGDFRLMSRRVVDILVSMPEHDRFLRGMVSWIGGRQVALPYERHARYAGATKYPLSKMIRFATDAVTSFSAVPLRLSMWLGLVAAAIAVLLLVMTVVQWMMSNVVPGWSSLMVAVSGFAAVQLIVLGVIGEYLGRLVNENKRRPLFLIDTITSSEIAVPHPVRETAKRATA